MIESKISPVAPRFFSLCTGAVLPLADEIERLIDRGERISVQIEGEGKSSALSHLAFVHAEHVVNGTLRLEDKTLPLDDVDPIVTVRTAHESQSDVRLRLAPWGRDDFIEYLLSQHPQQCASVMARLSEQQFAFAFGSSTVWKLILDRMAGNPDLVSVEDVVVDELHLRLNDEALANAVADRLILPASRNEVGEFGHDGVSVMDDMSLILRQSHQSVRQFLSHEDVRIAFAMRRFIDRLAAGDLTEARYLLSRSIRLGRLKGLAQRLRSREEIQAKLNKLFRTLDSRVVKTGAMSNCATLLSLCDRSWRPSWPPSGPPLSLFRGYFQGVSWPGVVLVQADLRQASFVDADLSGSRLGDSRISLTDFAFADLRQADFRPSEVLGLGRDTSSEDVQAPALEELKKTSSLSGRRKKENAKKKSKPQRSKEKRQRLKQARRAKSKEMKDLKAIQVHARTNFANSDLSEANMSGCRFQAASFTDAMMQGIVAENAEFDKVDFSRADLTGAVLSRSGLADVVFADTTMDGSKFTNVYGEELILDNIQAESVDFSGALLMRSNWTGSRLSKCVFENTFLTGARLADIDWEDCDLRRAKLVGCTFHLGTTRSGIVGSPYPSHGTRTGFYTDEYEEQYFKSPDEVSVASLRGADLRGAIIRGVDFYLVDLRGAKYDDSQREQLISTGAILDES